jgi:Flp pilus assembly protein TadG
MKLLRRKREHRRLGVVLVETALIFPILLLLTFGLIEYGWLFLKMETLANASRRGARIAARPDATSGEVIEAINNMMTAGGVDPGRYQVTLDPADISSVETGDVVTVRVVVDDYDSISLTGSPLFPVPEQIEGEMAIAKEGI